MLSASEWSINQPNTILFVLIDTDGVEVTGLGSAFSLQLSKGGAAFVASAGIKSEVGFGWYRYISTTGEADTPGPIAIVVNHASVVQQNLEFVVETRVVDSVEFTYTVTSTAGNVPIAGVGVRIFADAIGVNIVWSGITDALGIARDYYGNKPRLTPGTYYFFRDKSGYAFDNPDVENVS